MQQQASQLPDLSNDQPLGVACISAILVEIQRRHGQESQPRAPEVNAQLGELRALLMHCTMLDSPRGDYQPPSRARFTAQELEVIDSLVAQAKISTEPDSPLWVLAESVRDIVLRHKGRPIPAVREVIDEHMRKVKPDQAKVKYPLEYFEWHDSKQPGTGWHFTCDIKETKPIHCTTVGYVMKETDDLVMVAQTIGDLDGPEEQYIGGIQIVKRGIISRRKLVQLIEG